MSKITKVILVIMIASIVIYIVTGIYNINNPELNNDNINSGDVSSGENDNLAQDDYLSNLTYELTSGENEVILTVNGSGEKSSTFYIFENDKVSQIMVKEEVFSGDELETMYEQLKNDATLSQAYSSIEKSGDSVIMILRQEYVDIFAGKTKESLYQELESSMENK